MHELGHLLIHKISSIDDERDMYSYQGMERNANAFAGLVLVPDSFLLRIQDANRPQEVSEYENWLREYTRAWEVSTEVVLRRLLDEGRLMKVAYLRFYMKVIANGVKLPPPLKKVVVIESGEAVNQNIYLAMYLFAQCLMLLMLVKSSSIKLVIIETALQSKLYINLSITMLVFDASSMIYVWDNYPEKQFPPLWKWMATQVEQEVLVMPKVAFEEVEHKAPDCALWLKTLNLVRLEVTNAILQDGNRIKGLIGVVGDDYGSNGVGENDLLIIATASVHGFDLVSDEAKQAKLPTKLSNCKIPPSM